MFYFNVLFFIYQVKNKVQKIKIITYYFHKIAF